MGGAGAWRCDIHHRAGLQPAGRWPVRRVQPSAEAMTDVPPLLNVRNLKVHFFTQAGVAPAVDGIDFRVNPRETLGLVGESGSGKTMASLAVLRLVPPPARIVSGSIEFQNRDLLTLDEAALRDLRGKHVAMIFQNPAYSLNPIFTIGDQ